MLFSTPTFLFAFLPLLLAGYFLAPAATRNTVLVIASLVFYAWGETVYVLLILLSALGNHCFALCIERKKPVNGARFWLTSAICFNLLMLVVFKYTNFIVASLGAFLQHLELPAIEPTSVHLPLGISFFTLQAISYIVDVYRRDVEAQRRFTNCLLYISLFPQLIAGPIVRYKHIAASITKRSVSADLFVSGVGRFSMGLGKKVLLADPLGHVADIAFATPVSDLTTPLVWLGAICFTLQIYFDFSGYSDMAIGMGRMFGFRFQENFNFPYIARSMREFWRRWHISLSTWFRDYLYIPLGGSRLGMARTYLNLFVVFLLCGIWHGAAWQFIVWGLFHGFFLALERAGLERAVRATPRFFQHCYLLTLVVSSMVIFRAPTLSYGTSYLQAMYGFPPLAGGWQDMIAILLAPDTLLALVIGILLTTPIYRLTAAHIVARYADRHAVAIELVRLSGIAALLLLAILAVVSTTYRPFIYFQF